jgi:hypothetical protein
MKPSAIVLIGALVLAPACTEPLSPSQFAGTYQFMGVNNNPLPVTIPALPDSCTAQFSFGQLHLADGAFSFYYTVAYGCPGLPTAVGQSSFGGALTVQGRTLVLRAIDPTSPTQAVIEGRITITGSEADLVLPAGALDLASPTTLNFYNGPTLQEFPHSRSN